MSQEYKDIVVAISGDGNCFFYALYLADNSLLLTDETIGKRFGENLFLSADDLSQLKGGRLSNFTREKQAMSIAIRKYRETAFKPMLDVLKYFQTKLKRGQVPNEDDDNRQFNEYNKLVNPHLTKFQHQQSDNRTREFIDALTCNNPTELREKSKHFEHNYGFIDEEWVRRYDANLYELFLSKNIWAEEHNVYEIEKYFNIKILTKFPNKRTGEVAYLLSDNLDLLTYIPDNNLFDKMSLIVLSNDLSHYELVVTKRDANFCAKYSITYVRGQCVLSPYYKTLIIDALLKYVSIGTGNNVQQTTEFVSFLKGEIPVEPMYGDIGTETSTGTIESGSNYSDSSEHVVQTAFAKLFGMVSFEDSLRDKIDNTIISASKICTDERLISLLKETGVSVGLLGGGRKGRTKKRQKIGSRSHKSTSLRHK